MKRFFRKYLRIGLLLASWLTVSVLAAQERMSTEEYIEQYKDVAIKKMKEYGIPASITLAQGILESGSGNSALAREANNHFGIKCHKDWTGKRYYMDDDEKDECFRKYKHASDSYRDHSLFLTQRGRYSFLFDYDVTDYKSWAYGLKKAGYATNPKYPELLIRIIERYELDRFDRGEGRRRKHKKPEPPIEEPAAVAVVVELDSVGVSPEGRTVFENNGTKLVLAQEGDDFYKLAREFDVYSWQLFKYNEADKHHQLRKGEPVYLEKKKGKAAKKYKTHVVQLGESMRELSQRYGVRLKKLYKLNKMFPGEEAPVGTEIRLR